MPNDASQLSRRSILTGLLAASAGPALARAPGTSLIPPVRPQTLVAELPARAAGAPTGLADLLARSGVSGETALIALDAETGAIIEEHRANLRLPPASTAKALTAMYALHHLGSEYRFATRVEARGGSIEGGVLRGDLILRGGGDPVLQTDDLARLADELIQRGLRRVDGRFLADDSALPEIRQIDQTQPAPAGYNPAVSGLNLNFNRVHFGWEVQGGRATLTMDARSEREVPPVSVIDIRAVSRGAPVYTHELRANSERWTVAAGALGASGSRWLPVRRPGAYAADVFRALLLARGCQIPEPRIGRASSGAVLAEHRSDPLSSILRGMLRYSTNITAESVGLAATLAGGRSVRMLGPSAERMNAWIAERYGVRDLALVDHSGLGDQSRVSVNALAHYMLEARREGILPDLLRDHTMRDDNGRPVSNHPVSVQAKTGTLNFVSALTGLAQRRDGRPIVFAIISADLPSRRAIRDEDGERPAGTGTFTARARRLQQDLIERWAGLYG